MPLGLDLTKRIINVQWGGGKSLIVTDQEYGAFKVTVDPGGRPKIDGEWNNISADIGVTFSGAYAYVKKVKDDDPEGRPIGSVFVIGGTLLAKRDDGAVIGRGGIISVSSNGKEWSTAFQRIPGNTFNPDVEDYDTVVLAIVWNKDDEKFYAEEFYAHWLHPDPLFQEFYKILHSSEDGKHWIEVKRQQIADPHDPDFVDPRLVDDPNADINKSGLITPYCNGKAKDARGTSLPDGLFGYWEKKDDDGAVIESILIVPDKPPLVLYGNGDINYDQRGTGVKVTKQPLNETSSSDVDFPISAAAYDGSGNVAAVTGGPDDSSLTALSGNLGATWATHHGTAAIYGAVVLAAPEKP